MKLANKFCLGLKCDKLVMELFVSSAMYNTFLTHIYGGIDFEKLIYHPFIIKRVPAIRGYHIGIEDIVLMRGDKQLLRMEVTNPGLSGPSLIISYSPENAYLFGADALIAKILQHTLTGPLKNWHLMGRISRIDYAYDVAERKSNLLVARSYTRTIKSVGTGDPTHYHTRKTTENGFMFYNKYEHMLECYDIDLAPLYDLTRFEFRVEPRHGMAFFDGPRLISNPFERVDVYDLLDAMDILKDSKYAFIAEAIDKDWKPEGFTQLLKQLTPYHRYRVKLLLLPATPDWWRPFSLWQEVHDMLRRYQCLIHFAA